MEIFIHLQKVITKNSRFIVLIFRMLTFLKTGNIIGIVVIGLSTRYVPLAKKLKALICWNSKKKI